MHNPVTDAISGRATPSALIEILRPSFLEIALNGLKTLSKRKIFIIFRLLEYFELSIYENNYLNITLKRLTVTNTTKKSKTFQGFRR
jgi:hypothetical protein